MRQITESARATQHSGAGSDAPNASSLFRKLRCRGGGGGAPGPPGALRTSPLELWPPPLGCVVLADDVRLRATYSCMCLAVRSKPW